MQSLLEMVQSESRRKVQLPANGIVEIRTLHVRFPPCPTGKLQTDSLSRTYTSKPLVLVGTEPLFGELAIVRLLENDGWTAVWVDTFHGRKFWRKMPNKSSPVLLPPIAKRRYDEIVAINGKPSGFFDVMAWKDDRIIHLEYKGQGDSSNKNETKWIDAAISAGVDASDLFFVTY